MATPDYRLKKDLVIPAGTRFSPAPTKTERAGDGHIEAVFGLSANTYGTVYYSLDPAAGDDLSEWFEEWAEVIAEAERIVESGQSNPTTFRAFGRDFTAGELMSFTIDLAAMSRISSEYAGETPEEWARQFGLERRKVIDDMARLVRRKLGGI